MSISRAARPDEIKALVALSDLTFRKPGQSSMGTAYSMLFAESNAGNLLVMEEDGKLVTLVGLLPVQLSVAGCTVSAVSMGSVCTDAAYRGKNYADTLVKQSIAKCRDEGVHLLLVSGSRGLYQRNDCLEVGAIKRFTIRSAAELERLRSDAAAETMSRYQDIRYYQPELDLPVMLQLMQAERVYYQRTEEELAQLIQSSAVISNHNGEQFTLISYTDSGEPDAYIVLGLFKPGDEATVEIVEFAGSDEAVLHLLNEVWVRHNPKQLHLPVANNRASLAEKLALVGCSFREIPIPGTIRMIDFVGLWGSLQPYMVEQLGEQRLSELRLTEAGENFRIEFRGESFTVDAAGATRLMFNGTQLAANGPLKSVLSELFPLPFVYTNNLNFV